MALWRDASVFRYPGLKCLIGRGYISVTAVSEIPLPTIELEFEVLAEEPSESLFQKF